LSNKGVSMPVSAVDEASLANFIHETVGRTWEVLIMYYLVSHQRHMFTATLLVKKTAFQG
jgi:hypothetical protein